MSRTRRAEFNSFMSALADVVGRVVKPGTVDPPQRGALDQVRDWLVPRLDPDAADRGATGFVLLIRLRHIRVSTQHADPRHKAVDAFREIGLPFPPQGWLASGISPSGGKIPAMR
jgi:hypothetical protein